MSMLIPGALVLFLGAVVLARTVSGWRQAIDRVPAIDDGMEELPIISVIIPVRDASTTLAPLLQDLYVQSMGREHFEVVVVDDGSTDHSTAIARGMQHRWTQLRILKAMGEGKKAAITTGVHEATGRIMLLTDADARCGPRRLQTIATYWVGAKPDLLLLPVRTVGDGGVLARIQEDEQAALQGVTAGAASEGRYLLANGANLAFSKEAFNAVGGYKGDRYASGDDVFLLARMEQHGGRIAHLSHPDALVTVAPENNVHAFLLQRIRWAGKMRGLPLTKVAPALLGLLYPWVLLLTSVWVAQAAVAGQGSFEAAALVSVSGVLWLASITALTGDQRERFGLGRSGATALASYLAFAVYAPLIAVLSLFVRPRWKGRRV